MQTKKESHGESDCVRVCVCVCVVCVSRSLCVCMCVCMRVRKRRRKRANQRLTATDVIDLLCLFDGHRWRSINVHGGNKSPIGLLESRYQEHGATLAQPKREREKTGEKQKEKGRRGGKGKLCCHFFTFLFVFLVARA